MLLDSSVASQTYIEDCETCCHPIQVTVGFENSDLINFSAINIEQ